MKKTMILLTALVVAGLTSCQELLTKEPLASFTDDNFWVSEANVRGFAFGYYADRFPGFGNNDSGGVMSIRQALNDDYTNINLPGFNAQPTNKDGLWGAYFSDIRKDNIFVNRVTRVPFGDEETANHWLGVARFFRAFDYSLFAFSFGDVPYYDHEVTVTSDDRFKGRDDVTYVMDRVLEDYEFAAANVLLHDTRTGPDGLTVTRDVVDAFLSRHLLMMGTKLKYDPDTTPEQMERVAVYLQAAKDAAWRVVGSGRYKLASNYQKLCSTVDITATDDVKKEMILYRVYDTGLVTHAIMSGNRETTAQAYSAPKDLIDTYLCSNGLPVNPKGAANPAYKGDKSADEQMFGRDPRLTATFRPKFYVQYDETGYAHTGFKCWKFLDEATQNETTGTQSFNITDAPVIRLGEVMLNYIEAAAELADLGLYTVTQDDVDATINALRKRAGYAADKRLPDLKIVGGLPAVGSVTYDDAERDPEVPPFIWEVRRERRVELVFEGFRLNDLKRWRRIDYTNTDLYPKKNLGAWITKSNATKTLVLADITGKVVSGADELGSGYLKVSQTSRNATNGYVLDRNYWECVPIYEIDYYARNGSRLEQNPGWPQGSGE